MIGEIKHQQEMRPATSVIQILIEILVKRGVLCHENIMGLDDIAISTQQVSDMYAAKFGEARRPNGNTIRSNGLKYGLGTKINKNFQHSKRQWDDFLETVCIFEPKE